MTHGGGKPHAVGDEGQRYEVSVFDEERNERIVVGWTDDAGKASALATSAALKPSWRYERVTDRQAAGATAPADVWKQAHAEEARKFQNETRRTSALTQLLHRWMQRAHDQGCRAEPWVKQCRTCDLMIETKALLESPINAAPTAPVAFMNKDGRVISAEERGRLIDRGNSMEGESFARLADSYNVPLYGSPVPSKLVRAL